MICMSMVKHGVLIFSKVEIGNKLLTITILENNIAGKGHTFDSAKDKFISASTLYNSWSLDGNDDWQAPVTFPTDIGTAEDRK